MTKIYCERKKWSGMGRKCIWKMYLLRKLRVCSIREFNHLNGLIQVISSYLGEDGNASVWMVLQLVLNRRDARWKFSNQRDKLNWKNKRWRWRHITNNKQRKCHSAVVRRWKRWHCRALCWPINTVNSGSVAERQLVAVSLSVNYQHCIIKL